jgi:hypothetical protein
MNEMPRRLRAVEYVTSRHGDRPVMRAQNPGAALQSTIDARTALFFAI